MGRKTQIATRLTTIAIAALVVAALPGAAGAAPRPDGGSPALLAKGAGYAQAAGSQRVRALQRRLRLAGAAPGPLDGRFGPLTEAAVVGFQRAQGLAVDGLVGAQTQRALKARAALLARGAGYAAPQGSRRVRALQRSLRAAGEQVGPLDGRFGPQTEAAVARFQRRHGLAGDGLAGAQTTAALRRQLRLARARSPQKSKRRPAAAAPAAPSGPAPAADSGSGPALSSAVLAALVAGLALGAGAALTLAGARARPQPPASAAAAAGGRPPAPRQAPAPSPS
jgi:peptidoglycan hydrolase-like protein with peptidoglycan-binding domain